MQRNILKEKTANRGNARAFFSIYYGQDYSLEDERNCIGGPYTIRSLKDVQKINFFTPVKEIATLFEGKFTDSSGVYVHEVVNIVFLIRAVVSHKPADRRHGGSQLRSEEEEREIAETRKKLLSRPVTRSQAAAHDVYKRRKGELLHFFSRPKPSAFNPPRLMLRGREEASPQ